MAQGRFISRTIAIDPQLALLSQTAEWLYLKAIPHLDRDGICTGEPYALLGMISPFRFSELQGQMSDCIDEWVDRGLVIRYSTSTGAAIWFKGFAKQQKLQYEREAPSQYGPPPGYVRTAKGLVRATDVPWTSETVSDSRVLTQTLESEAKTLESWPQAKAKAKAKQQDQAEVQQQQQEAPTPAPEPAAAAAAVGAEDSEVRRALQEFGISGRVLDELSACPLPMVRGWIDYALTQPGLRTPIGYVIKQLRARAPAPYVQEKEDPESYEALLKRYVPDKYKDIMHY